MTLGDDERDGIGLSTARGRDWPTVRQFNVFLANRMGALLDLVRKFETTDVRIVSLTVIETADCAIIRLVTGAYDRGFEVLTAAKFPFTESDLLVVKIPDNDQPLLTITAASAHTPRSTRNEQPTPWPVCWRCIGSDGSGTAKVGIPPAPNAAISSPASSTPERESASNAMRTHVA